MHSQGLRHLSLQLIPDVRRHSRIISACGNNARALFGSVPSVSDRRALWLSELQNAFAPRVASSRGRRLNNFQVDRGRSIASSSLSQPVLRGHSNQQGFTESGQRQRVGRYRCLWLQLIRAVQRRTLCSAQCGQVKSVLCVAVSISFGGVVAVPPNQGMELTGLKRHTPCKEQGLRRFSPAAHARC
jgi:hypothetical protein